MNKDFTYNVDQESAKCTAFNWHIFT